MNDKRPHLPGEAGSSIETADMLHTADLPLEVRPFRQLQSGAAENGHVAWPASFSSLPRSLESFTGANLKNTTLSAKGKICTLARSAEPADTPFAHSQLHSSYW